MMISGGWWSQPASHDPGHRQPVLECYIFCSDAEGIDAAGNVVVSFWPSEQIELPL